MPRSRAVGSSRTSSSRYRSQMSTPSAYSISLSRGGGMRIRKARPKYRVTAGLIRSVGAPHVFQRRRGEIYLNLNGLQSGASVYAIWSQITDDGTTTLLPPGLATGTVVQNPASPALGWLPFCFKFSLSDVIDPNEFTELFDQYQLRSVKMLITRVTHVQPTNAGNSGDNGLACFPELISVPDFDDASATPYNVIQQYEKARTVVMRDGATVTKKIYPKVAEYIYKSDGTGIAFAQGRKKLWIDCASPTADHYGMKFVLNNLPIGNSGGFPAFNDTQTFRIQMIYTIAFKNVK